MNLWCPIVGFRLMFSIANGTILLVDEVNVLLVFSIVLVGVCSSLLIYLLVKTLDLVGSFELRSYLTVIGSLGVLVSIYLYGPEDIGSSLEARYVTGFLCLVGLAVVMSLITWWETGLVEINQPPPRSVKEDVFSRHQIESEDVGSETLKRGFDVTLALLGLIAAAPFGIAIALLIWLEDPGPIFFSKVCVGKDGRSFRQLKFRSMVKNAEEDTGPVLARRGDPRITRIGRLMRKTAVDEVPQLLNILVGQMSFVGPRPQRTVLVQEHMKEVRNYARRHRVRPGLTGVAQVYASYYVPPRQKLRYDLLYIRRRSIPLDCQLIILSVWISVSGGWQNKKSRDLFR